MQRKKNKAIYLVTVPKVPEEFASTKYNVIPPRTASRKFLESILLEWDIPELRKGNGVLILFSTGDRSIEIRSAANLKYILKDRYIQGIIDNVLIPNFQKSEFSAGSLSAIEFITRKITNPYFNSVSFPQTETVQSIVLHRCLKKLNKRYHGEYAIFNRSSENCLDKTISYFGGSGTW